MKKISLLLFAVFMVAIHAHARFPYRVTTLVNQPYTPLTGGTSVNGTDIWDDDEYMVPMPFTFSYNGRTTNTFNLSLGEGGFISGIMDTVSGFVYGEMDIADKGQLTSAATLSPVRYLVTGSAPNRIFKFEIANAGFYDEIDQSGTTNDSVNIQIWLYETSNIVELRYGPSHISTTDYFFLGAGPLVGYVGDADLNVGFDKIYTLSGNPSAPSIDTLDFNTGTGSVLTSYPANGTVYRFTPATATGVSSVPAFANMQVYPTVTSTQLHVNFNERAAADYEVIGMDGRATGITGKIGNGANSLDVSRLAAGMYLLRVENSTNRSIYRFMKK